MSLSAKSLFDAKIEVPTLDALLEVTHEVGQSLGFSCSAFITVADGGRKPPHFKDRTRSLYFNLKTVEAERLAREEHPDAYCAHELTCAVCTGFAGTFYQHRNRDKGFGICADCAAAEVARGTSSFDMIRRYGIVGHNYAPPECSAAQQPARSMAFAC